jgi:CBS domain-containing protein
VAGAHSAFPVVAADGAVVGIVSRRDVLDDQRNADDPVTAVMTTDVVTVRPSDVALTALHLMVDERVEHVPVLDDGRLVGICTRTDLLEVRRAQREHEIEQPGALSRGRSRWIGPRHQVN